MFKLKKNKNTNKEKGASLVEYGLLVALITVVVLAVLTSIGGKVSQNFSKIDSGL